MKYDSLYLTLRYGLCLNMGKWCPRRKLRLAMVAASIMTLVLYTVIAVYEISVEKPEPILELKRALAITDVKLKRAEQDNQEVFLLLNGEASLLEDRDNGWDLVKFRRIVAATYNRR